MKKENECNCSACQTRRKRPDTYFTRDMEIEGNLWVGGKIYQRRIDWKFFLIANISCMVGVLIGHVIRYLILS